METSAKRIGEMPIGSQWNYLTVMAEIEGRKKRRMWLCRCVCGTLIELSGVDLRRGRKSCGCQSYFGQKAKAPLGRQFGDWTVVGHAGKSSREETLWLCRCVCGVEKPKSAAALRRGRSAGCGCRAAERIAAAQSARDHAKRQPKHDLAGRAFGLLSVRCLSEKKIHGAFAWVCDCGCGKETIVLATSLLTGVTTSCGCKRGKKAVEWSRNHRRLPLGISQAQAIMRRYAGHALRKEVPFELTLGFWWEIIRQPCHYCGRAPEQEHTRDGFTLLYNGVDRKVPKEGYVESNVVPACKQCNLAKGKTPYDDFLPWIKRVYEHNFL